MIRAALALGLLAACTDEVNITPIIDVPDNDTDASAFGVIDELVIAIAPNGDPIDLVTKRFARGDALDIADVPFGSNLVMHLTGLTGTRQVGYGRTCTFAVAPGSDAIEPHVFFSSSRKFATTNIATEPRTGGQAIAFGGGAILVGGGTQTIEQFDPLTGQLTNPDDHLVARDGAVGALLGVSPSRIALIGGVEGSAPATVVELFDPREGLDTIDDARMGRQGLTATSLADGRVIVIGGYAPGSPPVGTITQLEPVGTGAEITDVAVLAHPRWGHTATRLGDDLGAPVLIAGGLDAQTGGVAVVDAELFRPLSGTVSPAFAKPMRHPRTQHHAARIADGSVLILGGIDAAGNPVRALERFTIDEGFVDVVDVSRNSVSLPASIGVVDMTVTQLPDGRLLVAGGRPDGPNGAPTDVAFVVSLDPGTGTPDIGPTDKLAVARANHQAALLCDGTVWISGGADELRAERYNPPPAGRR